jgi:hypothetical protein
MTITQTDATRTEADINVLGLVTVAPTSGLTPGDAYLIVSPATGLFAGRENELAVFTARNPSTPWEFSTPRSGGTAYDAANAIYWEWGGAAWAATTAFDRLGTSTEAPSGHMLATQTHNIAGTTTDLQSASPISVFHFYSGDPNGGFQTITADHDLIVIDCMVVQAAPAGGVGCSVTVETTGGQLLFDALPMDAVSSAIVRATASKLGVVPLVKGSVLKVTAIDNGATQFPLCSIFLTIAKV